MDIINKEIRDLSQQYSITSIEKAALEKRVEVQAKNLHDSRNRVQDLMAKLVFISYFDCKIEYYNFECYLCCNFQSFNLNIANKVLKLKIVA